MGGSQSTLRRSKKECAIVVTPPFVRIYIDCACSRTELILRPPVA